MGDGVSRDCACERCASNRRAEKTERAKSVPCEACHDTGKIGDRRCPVCHGEPLTYEAFENLSNYVRTINLNVPEPCRQPQLDLSMVRMRDALAEARKDTERLDWLEKQLDEWRYHADFAIQSDEEDGVWFARITRHHCGTLPQGIAYDDGKAETVRAAIDAALAAKEPRP